ncbi:MAG TPA: c-type cytochrome, partial [Terriglobales bacterium]|nr:c-type cytochrome [Terriglobales bacterium]
MNSLRDLFTFATLSMMLLTACSSPPGQPAKDSEDPAPSEINDFRVLYAENCAACHGADGRGGAAIALA